MSFHVGQTVVHPHHGAATIDDVEEREINGEPAQYLVLSAPATDLTLMIPADQCDNVGIRAVIDADEVDDIIAVLGDDPSPVQGHWSRRLKRNQNRLRSGDPKDVATVLRDLDAKNEEKGLSPAEKRLHAQARIMLCGELAAVLDGGEEAADKLVDEVLGHDPETVDA